ncbi:heparan-alpha-glucosaminide N-acetyltransferase-like [Argonauta hians]
MSVKTLLLLSFICCPFIHALEDELLRKLTTCGNTTLKHKINTANIVIQSESSSNLIFYSQSTECWKCDLKPVAMITPGDTCYLRVDSRWQTRYMVKDGKDELCHENTFHFQEDGNYNLMIYNTTQCSQVLTNQPPDSLLPIYIFIGVVFLIILLRYTCYLKNSVIFRKIVARFSQERLIEADLGSPDSITPTNDHKSLHSHTMLRERLKSLDTFRGINILAMIFVNYGGGEFWFFRHSPWNGLTVADIVFPWFVFIMGTSMAYSFRSMMRKDFKKITIMKKIVWRTLLLFFLGIIVNCISSKGIKLQDIRVPGVLQRFAATYFIVAVTHMFSAQPADSHQFVWWNPIQDIVLYWLDCLVALSLLIIYICITFCLPVPGCPKGYLGPGGLSERGSNKNCTGGAAGYIDREVFGISHLYSRGTFKEMYHTHEAYDPEGLLGTLTTCFICFVGLQAGKIFLMFRVHTERVKRFLIWAVVLGCISLALTGGTLNDGLIPINKNLWSISFICATAALAFVTLTLCYLAVDVSNIWSGAPCIWAGMNAIALYMGHEIFSRKFPVYWNVPSNHLSLFFMSMWGTTFWLLISGFMHYKRLYFSV